MTPTTLLQRLAAIPANSPLIFRTDRGEISGGYHVTELKLADVRSIDCGARQSSWQELSIQLLDGGSGEHMAVGKFRNILSQSIKLVDGLGQAPMQVEFAHGNAGTQLFKPSEPQLHGDKVIVHLMDVRAVCKPSLDAASQQDGDALGCCETQSADDCCGAAAGSPAAS